MAPVDFSACLAAPVAQPFSLADEVPTQVNLDLAMAGNVLWVAYDGPATDGSADLDVYVARLGCDQTLLGAPLVASTAAATLDGDLSIATNGDGAVVAWLADDRSGGANLSIRTRAYGLDGAPMDPEERTLGIPAEGEVTSAWMPRVTDAGVGFWLTGTQVVPSAQTFQMFVQRLDQAGGLQGTPSTASAETHVFHANPDVAVDPDGRPRVLLERTVDQEVRLAQAAFVGEHLAITHVEAEANVAAPRWARGDRHSPLVQTWGTGASAGAVVLRVETEGGQHLAEVGDATRRNVLPAAAMHGRAGLVSWHEAISPTTGKVLAASFAIDGTGIRLGPVMQVAELALNYGPAVVHVVDDLYVVGWTLPSAGDRLAKGAFISAPPP